MPAGEMPSETVEDLLAVVERLRDPGGCPWDREQTHASLRPNLLEESYEALEALDSGDADGLAEELGDLLVQVTFHADIARRAGEWTLADVIARTIEKLVSRHPHVFAENGPRLTTAEEVSDQWDALKRAEPGRESIADGLPPAMPALAYAAALQRRAARAGLAWRGRALGSGERAGRLPDGLDEAGAGRLLFELARQVQAAGIDPEAALRAETLRFRERIRSAEVAAPGSVPLADLPADERTRLWEESGG